MVKLGYYFIIILIHQIKRGIILKIPIKKLLGLLISIAIIFAIFHNIDWGKTLEAFKSFNAYYLFLIIPAYYSSFIFRTIRWQVLLNNNSYKKNELAGLIFIGNTLNSFLPARAGDIYRAHALGSELNIKKIQVFASIVMERLIDGIVVFLFLIFTIMKFCHEPWILRMAGIVGSIFIGGITFLFLITQFNLIEKTLKFALKHESQKNNRLNKIVLSALIFLNKHTTAFCEGLNIFQRPKQLVYSMLLTTVVWLIESATLFLTISSFGIKTSYLFSTFTLTLLVFSNLIPAASSMIGPYQLAYIKALSMIGIPKEMALAVAITSQSLIMLLLSSAGGLFLLKKNLNLKNIKTEFCSSNKTEANSAE